MWDLEYDVVVVGSGFAGLATALEAHEGGATVIVLEKMHAPGGNSSISGGLVAAAASPLQEELGIVDSPELLAKDMFKAGQDMNHHDLVKIVAEQSTDALRWTIEKLGVEYKPCLNILGGHSVARTYNTANASGSGIIRPMLQACRKNNIQIRMKAMLSEIVRKPNGRVEGVVIKDGYLFPSGKSGTPLRIRARRGVVLATGGYSRDIAFRTIQNPILNEKIESTNQPGATAEGLVAALKIGATPIQLAHIQLGPWASSDEAGFGVGSMFSMLAGFPYGILVDARTGKRFVNELSDRRLRVDAMLKKKRFSIAITDSSGVRFASTLNKCLKRGVVRQYETIEQLAIENNIKLDNLLVTIERYNRSVSLGHDMDFGKPLQKDLQAIETPPFYAIRLTPKVHHCMGGVQIDREGRVLDIETHEPIPGLFAAGEVTGGIHGASRLGSVAITDCLVFGRIAGRNAANEPF
ncbi:flavocytochrome c [Desulfofustis glycolicus]|uniref:Flavocytochrome c n=1 Tax=Desulfofustis glycolicus DSM 9705 TaxID=1121409 RepID=A0A1M5XAC1_9BACT|nr:flavocytochrome c [Desulfofustis glycolicus]SHH96669.1 flavocytochrome c [Desulfofustis glycolicus DSM 9705]